ncbi:MAG: dTDP-4-dehydrorhamnose reductase [Chloroflexota bacterium]|nr:dTDP-4-dehydrorhamnose reductase [Chloroflexota bacterium]MDP6508902.1 dTDP-4-dehydrorhamnose reductase [Chloroflexota bacterium]MDP6757697.1 dTDP-4-dehydrorhamnose reductase [Chloroflexota bacterium]
MTRILVTGAGGQLGRDLGRRLPPDTTRLATREELDVADAGAAAALAAEFAPTVVIHTAAMTNVDACEGDRERAQAINAGGARNVAIACREAGAAMVYVSTNYVFDGCQRRPYDETDATNPISIYGATKLAGEHAVIETLDSHFVVRTSTLYGPHRRNFVNSLVAAAASRDSLSYVDDQRVTPTSTADLAGAILELIKTDDPGMYHLVNQGETSWYGWARAVLTALEIDGVELNPISAAEFERPAAVPANGVLANNAARARGVELRGWQEALTEFLNSHIKGVS